MNPPQTAAANACCSSSLASLGAGYRQAVGPTIPLPSVEVVENAVNSAYRYNLTHGAHRLYGSFAVGFSHIPTVCGFDVATLDSWRLTR